MRVREHTPAWPQVAPLLAAALVLALAGCASRAPPRVAVPPLASGERDGAHTTTPADLHLVPDAEPRVELPRSGGPNKPYEVLGQSYVPLTGDPALAEQGLASWYGAKFHGRPTASGEVYDMYSMSAAHRTMPLPSYARVRNPANGREVVVRINDRGPFHAERVIDLSYTAALKLGLLGGVAPVQVERITTEAIRNGSWRLPGARAGVGLMPEPAGGVADPLGELMRRAAERPEPPRAPQLN
jgi:rare lipoprotein A